MVAAGCGSGDLVLPSDGGPARMVIVQGNEQVGNAGSVLADSLVVRVTDLQDRAISGLPVAFDLGAGAAGGGVNPATTVTDDQGLAAAEWVLGNSAGTQAVDARVVGASLTVQFTASAGPGGASRLVLESGDGQSAAVGTALEDSLVVRVEDDFGNPVAGMAVDWTAGVGDVSPASTISGSDGHAATRRILGAQAGTQTAAAAAPGLAGSPVTFTHTAVPGTASSLVLISGDGQSGPPGEELPDPLVVRLVDQSGNGIPSQAVSWIAAGGGSVDPATSQTDGDGLASTRWTLGPDDTGNTVNAVVSGVGVVTFTASSEGGGGGGGGGGGSGPSASLSTVSADPTSIQAITGLSTITVTVRDGNGDPVAGAEVNLQATGAGNTLVQPGEPTGSDGVTTGTLRSTVPGTKVVSATINGSVQVNQTAQVTVSLAPASRVELLEGDDQSAEVGTAVDVRPAVRVTNDLGQPVAGFRVDFVVTGGGGNASGSVQTTNSDGVARVGAWTLGPQPGTNTLEARAGTLEGSPVVFTAEATPGANRLVFRVQPGNVDEDEPFSPPVEVAIVDGTGNVVPLSGIRIEIDLIRSNNQTANNRLDGDRNRDTQDGVAVFPGLRVDNDEDGYRLRASAEDLPEAQPVLSNSFDVND